MEIARKAIKRLPSTASTKQAAEAARRALATHTNRNWYVRERVDHPGSFFILDEKGDGSYFWVNKFQHTGLDVTLYQW